MSGQYHLQIRLPHDCSQWRRIASAKIPGFLDKVRERFGNPEYAPEMPPLKDGLQGFIKQPCRVLMMWIPDWAMSEDAGYHVVRIDTCVATQKALAPTS